MTLFPLIIGNETKDGDIRLVGGEHLWRGRVEMFLSGSWGTVTYNYNHRPASIVCRQLGYDPYRKSYAQSIALPRACSNKLIHY